MLLQPSQIQLLEYYDRCPADGQNAIMRTAENEAKRAAELWSENNIYFKAAAYGGDNVSGTLTKEEKESAKEAFYKKR